MQDFPSLQHDEHRLDAQEVLELAAIVRVLPVLRLDLRGVLDRNGLAEVADVAIDLLQGLLTERKLECENTHTVKDEILHHSEKKGVFIFRTPRPLTRKGAFCFLATGTTVPDSTNG